MAVSGSSGFVLVRRLGSGSVSFQGLRGSGEFFYIPHVG